MWFLPGPGFYSDANLTWHLRQVQAADFLLKRPVYPGDKLAFHRCYVLSEVVLPYSQGGVDGSEYLTLRGPATITGVNFETMNEEK